jgi:hypothetical protein
MTYFQISANGTDMGEYRAETAQEALLSFTKVQD